MNDCTCEPSMTTAWSTVATGPATSRLELKSMSDGKSPRPAEVTVVEVRTVGVDQSQCSCDASSFTNAAAHPCHAHRFANVEWLPLSWLALTLADQHDTPTRP